MAFHEYDFKVKFRNGRIEIGYFKEYQRPLRPSDAVWIIPTIILIILFAVFVLVPSSEAEAEMRDAFNAFKTGNAEVWAESVHPEHYEALGDLDTLKEKLGRNALAINPSSTVKTMDVEPPLVPDIPYSLTADVESGGNNYRVEMEYISAGEKCGIISVEVSFIYDIYGTPPPRFNPPVRTPPQ